MEENYFYHWNTGEWFPSLKYRRCLPHKAVRTDIKWTQAGIWSSFNLQFHKSFIPTWQTLESTHTKCSQQPLCICAEQKYSNGPVLWYSLLVFYFNSNLEKECHLLHIEQLSQILVSNISSSFTCVRKWNQAAAWTELHFSSSFTTILLLYLDPQQGCSISALLFHSIVEQTN